MKDRAMIGLRTNLFRLLWVSLAVAMVTSGAAYQAFASKTDLRSVGQPGERETVTLHLGKGDVLDIKGEVSDILVADPRVVDVSALQSGRLYMVGTSIGDTNILVVDAKGDVLSRIDVHVNYDINGIQALVDELFPDEKIEVGAILDQIYLKGTVSTPEVAATAMRMIAHYVSELIGMSDKPLDYMVANMLKVRGEQQVMLKVKIVEISRTVLKELGVDTNFNDENELATTTLFGATPPSSWRELDATGDADGPWDDALLARSATAAGLSGASSFLGRLLADTEINGLGMMEVTLNALEQANLANVLAEPNLVAVSGESAGFLAGGEIPVPSGRDQSGNVIITFRDFGVSLDFRPVVMSGERISLAMTTEVSSLDFSVAVAGVPGLDVRRASTTVEMASGGSMMIAGLLQSENVEGMTGVPGVSKAPVLGKLFESDSFRRNETELVVIVTPYLVEPYAEKDNAVEIARDISTPLSRAFSANLRRTYGDIAPDLLEEQGAFGYLLN